MTNTLFFLHWHEVFSIEPVKSNWVMRKRISLGVSDCTATFTRVETDARTLSNVKRYIQQFAMVHWRTSTGVILPEATDRPFVTFINTLNQEQLHILMLMASQSNPVQRAGHNLQLVAEHAINEAIRQRGRGMVYIDHVLELLAGWDQEAIDG